MFKKIIMTMLALLMVATYVPANRVQAQEGQWVNADFSTEGVLTWDPVDDPELALYQVFINDISFEIEPYGELVLDVYGYLRENGLGSDVYSLSVSALDSSYYDVAESWAYMFTYDADRTFVYDSSFESNIDSIVGYGNTVESPAFTVLEDSLGFIDSEFGAWYRLVDGTFVKYTEPTFEAGTYVFRTGYTIDGEEAENYRLYEDMTFELYVNGYRWRLCDYPTITETESYVEVESLRYEVEELVFQDYELPVSFVDNYFWLENLPYCFFYGGTTLAYGYDFAPWGDAYVGDVLFDNWEDLQNSIIIEKVSGPEWLEVNEFLDIGGSPETVGSNEDLVLDITILGKTYTKTYKVGDTWSARKLAILDIEDQVYTGNKLTPEVVVVRGSSTLEGSRPLIEGVDYTVKYKNNVKAGTATVIVKGKNNYTGSATKTFTIQPADIDGYEFLATSLFIPYTGSDVKLNPVVKYNGKALKYGVDYTLAYYDLNDDSITPVSTVGELQALTGEKYGMWTFVAVGKEGSNFTGMQPFLVHVYDPNAITDLSKATITMPKSKAWTEGLVEFAPEELTVTVGGKVLIPDVDYGVDYLDNWQAGTATVVIRGYNEYTGEVIRTFTITGVPLSKVEITGWPSTATMDDLENGVFDPHLIYGDYELEIGRDFEIDEIDPKAFPGTITFIIYGQGMFTGSIKKKVKIVPEVVDPSQVVELTAFTSNATYVLDADTNIPYEAGGVKFELGVNYRDGYLIEGEDYTVKFSNNTKPGLATDAKAPTATITFKGMFKGSMTVKFNIVPNSAWYTYMMPSDVEASTKPGAWKQTKLNIYGYNDVPLKAGVDYRVVGYYSSVNWDDPYDEASMIPYTDEDAAMLNIVYVVYEGIGGYEGRNCGEYYIIERNISRAKATIENKAYTGSLIELTADDIVLKDGTKVLEHGVDYTISGMYKDNYHKGKATVTVMGMGMYGGMATYKFKIVAKSFATKVNFDANGGTGKTIKPISANPGSTITLPQCSYALTGKKFAGWCTEKDGTGVVYNALGTYELSQFLGETVTFYAIWED